MLLRVGRGGGDRETAETLTIELKLPLDGSLTSLLIHEGVLFVLREAPEGAVSPDRRIAIPKNIIVSILKNRIEEERLASLNVAIVGKNDRPSVSRLLNGLGIEWKEQEKITKFGDILRIIKENCESLKLNDSIELSIIMKSSKLYIGYKDVRGFNDKWVTFQLFKTERYTGFTSTEHPYTMRQLTVYMSPEAALLALLGLYSSFVMTSDMIHHMLFFAPEEIGGMLTGKNIPNMFRIKEEGRRILAEVVRKKYSEELVVVEALLSAKMQEVMSLHNVSSISLILLRLGREGQTYKIHQQLPLNFYKRESPEFLGQLAELLEPSGLVLSRLAKNDNVEYNNLVSVVNGIYRYVVLGDQWGLYSAVRELHHAYIKVRNDEKAQNVAKRYLSLLKKLERLARLM